MEENLMEIFKKFKWINILLSVAYVFFGIALIIYPAMTSDIICSLIGAAALIFGIVEIITHFKTGIGTVGEKVGLAAGIFCILFGVFLLINPAFIRAFLPRIMGIFIIIDSSFKLFTSFELHNSNASNWWIVLLTSLIGITLGFVIVFNSISVGDFLTRLIGAAILIDGIENMLASFMSSKKNDGTIEGSFREKPDSNDDTQ